VLTTFVDDFLSLRHEVRRGVTFVRTAERRFVPFADLTAGALGFAAGLRGAGLRAGDPVVLVIPSAEQALMAILGCMVAGIPPAALYPPESAKALPKMIRYLDHVLERCGTRHVIASGQLLPVLSGSARAHVHDFATLAQTPADSEGEHPSSTDTALFQFTSGSTSVPKGVIVTHGCLQSNMNMIRTVTRMSERSVTVTWLPLYHDMGLIGTALLAIGLGCSLSVMSPLTFLGRPRLWLEEIARVGGTHTAAPNFAYGLCVKRVPDPSGLDLSSMEVFVCGGEPIIPETLERFAAHYAPAGLRAGAVVPAYGLAEVTLAASFTPYGRGILCDSVDAESLATDRLAVPPTGSSLRVPSCGTAMPGLDIRVADAAGRALAERRVGEIQVRGLSVSPGYINDPEATRESRTTDGWLRTGDLGYLAAGELYPCGRSKDVIIVRGRNLHAHDLEAAAATVVGVRAGHVVALGVNGAEGERLVVVAESNKLEQAESIADAIRQELDRAMSAVPHDVRVVRPGTLPKTSSGKLKRSETRELYLREALA
jgi:acyl-CoA synthetase (AMP-forming)/AMP-acid ligase II